MAAEQNLLTYFTTMDNQGGIIVRDAPKLDLDLYISNYRGRTRFERLLLIGQSSVPLCVDALKAAVAEAKRGKDIQRYRDAWECIRLAAPDEPEARWDDAWVTKTDRANKAETLRMETELKGYKNNLVKESIRIGHRDLGEHLESVGELTAASEYYIKMRPDASTQSHIQDVGKHVVSIMLQKRDWAGVLANVNKVLAVNVTSSDEQNAEQPYQKIVSGLAHLGLGKFYEAARCFLEISDPTNCQRYNDTVSPNDIATYGGLLALASMDRVELQSRVLDNSSFRSFLELEPHIRKAVSMFVNGRYSSCLEIIESYANDYLLDIYLQKHASAIFSQIRSKCIVQYFLPFSCVTLDSLNATFAKPGESIEPELVEMIKNGALNARINTIDKLLVAVSNNARIAMQKKALDAANNYEKEAIERIRRMNIVAADLEVKGSRKGGDGWPEDSRRLEFNSAEVA
ncbi:26S proteasome subunit RPN7-domain-containing protein [Annulohypoxylon truncatum]|uniref:26S proteasome subunit RPN7-domain-containing protein n=1 Tax=Annulohypoxylon truncatum TaxID=327061 RepID=UPI0020083AA5|nr:26S proteasome subunit RPN7-domain-containing protein [Annulohypoxylon truncatum]KAI1212206.1 26S proteasome subunit RPN7-domain-containing protein [Annulohypoxylon truncatum]